MIRLSAAEAYPRWAASYDHENVITALECTLVESLTPSLGGKRLIDVGCGTGRRLVGLQAKEIVGVEPCREMLEQGRSTFAFPPHTRLIEADGRAMPLPDATFDVVWCRLVIGHIADAAELLREIARIAAPAAAVIISDFHPQAYAAGLRRSFRDGAQVIDVDHFVHDAATLEGLAAEHGLMADICQDGTVNPAVQHFYAEAGRLEQYREQCGMPMVSVMRFCKHG